MPYSGWFLIGVLAFFWGLFGLMKYAPGPEMMTFAYIIGCAAGLGLLFGGYWVGFRRVP